MHQQNYSPAWFHAYNWEAVGDGEKAGSACSVRGESAWRAVKSIQLSLCMEIT